MKSLDLGPLRRGLVAATALGAVVTATPTGLHGSDSATTPNDTPRNERHARGLETIKTVGGPDYDRAGRALDALSPDMWKLIVADYGDVMARPGLDLKNRELVNVAAITALGNARPALEYHIDGMLNTGWSPRAVVETILHSAVYSGFPAAIDGLNAARDVFRERGIAYRPVSDRPSGDDWQLGIENLRAIGGDTAAEIAGAFPELAPELARLTVEFAHGEIWNRPGLTVEDRALATLAMVIANGNQDGSVRDHVEACLRLGWTRAQITEVLIQMPLYVGWPQALTAAGPALEVFERVEREGLSTASERMRGLGERRQAEDDETRYRRGLTALGRISQASGEAVVDSFDDIAPDLGRYIVEFSYGDVFARPNLDLKTRELATVAALTASGRTVDDTPLQVHVNAALNVGAERQEIVEAILHMLPYAGFVAVQQAMEVAAEVFAERGLTGATADLPEFINRVEAGTIVAISDGDFVAETYATGRLTPTERNHGDVLTVIRTRNGNASRRQIEVSNSVTGPPEALSLTRDGHTAFVVERLGRRAPGVELARELPPGRTLTAVDLSDDTAPRIADTVEIGPLPEAVRASPDGRRVAVVANTPEASLLQIVPYSEGRFGEVATFRLADLGITGDQSRPRGGVTATMVDWHPSGRFLAVNINTQNRVAFFEVLEGPDGRLDLRRWGNTVEVGADPFVGRFTPGGRHYLTADWGRDLTAETVEERLPEKPSWVSVIRLADPAAAGTSAEHRRIGGAETDLSSEGLAVSPDGRLVATVNMRGTAFPPASPRFQREATISLLTFDPENGSLTKIADYPFAGVLPEGASFDLTGDHLLVTVFQHHGNERAGGGIDVWRVTRGDRPSLTRLGRIPVPHGVHHAEVAR